MNILVVDAQGGGIGREIITNIKARNRDLEITAVGTNALATRAMLRAGADIAVTGENAVKVQAKKADIIIGPIGIVIADAQHGEITPKIAKSIGQSKAKRVLIPFQNCNNKIVGIRNINLNNLIIESVETLFQILEELEA